MVKPLLPPAYELVVLERDQRAFAHGRRAAARGVEDGTLYWTERNDRLELALVLEPEAPIETTLEVVHLFAVAAGDALGAHTAPAFPLAIRFPDRIIFDVFELARLRWAWGEIPEAGIPPWFLLGLEAEIFEPEESGHMPDRITLRGAGLETAASAPLVESLARHFLYWVARWQDEGFAPVRAAWNQRCENRGRRGHFARNGIEAAGIVEGLDAQGRYVIGGRAISLLELGRDPEGA